MIKTTIYRSNDGEIVSFSMDGHANFGDYGTDIVCAGVSAVTVGTVNAIEKLCGISAQDHCKSESGLLTYELPKGLDHQVSEKAQLLLEGMVVSLQSIVQSYGKYVKIKEKTREV